MYSPNNHNKLIGMLIKGETSPLPYSIYPPFEHLEMHQGYSDVSYYVPMKLVAQIITEQAKRRGTTSPP